MSNQGVNFKCSTCKAERRYTLPFATAEEARAYGEGLRSSHLGLVAGDVQSCRMLDKATVQITVDLFGYA